MTMAVPSIGGSLSGGRPHRHCGPHLLQRPAAAEPGLRWMPVPDLFLAQPPTQEHLAPVAASGEVHQPRFRVTKDDAPIGERLQMLSHVLECVPVLLADAPPAVQGRRAPEVLRTGEDDLSSLLDLPQGFGEDRQEVVRLFLGELALGGHAATPMAFGRSSRVVILGPGCSGCRPRRSRRTANIPTARAGSMSNDGLSPT